MIKNTALLFSALQRSLLTLLLLFFGHLFAGHGLFAQEQTLDKLFEGLSSTEFVEREAAHRSLLREIGTKALRPEAIKRFKDPKTDPETRMRLYDLLQDIFKKTEFKEKNGFIGINIARTRTVHNKEVFEVVQVGHVMPGLQGAKAGLKIEDQIIKIDDKRFETMDPTREFMERIGYSEPGKKAKLTILRDRKEMEIDVELMQRPGDLPPGFYNAEKDLSKSFEAWAKKLDL